MGTLSATLKVATGFALSASALILAQRLGGEHASAIATSPLVLLAGVSAGALLHVPANFIFSTLDSAARGMETQLESLGQNNRPAANEDILRKGRECALTGLKVVIHRFYKTAKADGDHDIAITRRFRSRATRWIRREQRATRRRDRPEGGAWMKAGLSFEAIARPSPGDNRRMRVGQLEDAAWGELCEAMAAAKVAIPKTFRPYFAGDPHCWLGWRRAGHLLLMYALKHDHDAFVGFTVDSLNRIEEAMLAAAQRPPLPPPDATAPMSHEAWPAPSASAKAKASMRPWPATWTWRSRG